MRNRLAVQVVAAVVLAVFAVGILASGDKVDAAWLRFYSAAVLASVVVLALWDRLLWKLSLVQRIKGVPRNLSGTWRGTLTSFWRDPETGQQIDPKPAYLVVRQSASAVSAVLLTDESRSRSTYGVVTPVDGASSLDYIYLNRPDSRVEHRSRIHHGCPATRLRGRYWTDRDSRGELDFTERRAHAADDYDSAAALFEVKES